MYVVGLTGGIASGKTTVADKFAELGITLVDADIVARQVVAAGTPGLVAISDHFGAAILLDDGSLNRALLREKIFSNDNDKRWLNQLLHPLINTELQRQLRASGSVYTLLVVPLLVENDLTHLCDHVLVVDVDEATQLSRTMQRDKVSEQQARAILAAQASRQQRLAVADSVIENKDIRLVAGKIQSLHEKFLELASAAMAD